MQAQVAQEADAQRMGQAAQGVGVELAELGLRILGIGVLLGHASTVELQRSLCKGFFATTSLHPRSGAHSSLMNPSATSQSLATSCGSCPSTSTRALSRCAVSVVSRFDRGSSRPAICGYFSSVFACSSGAAL